MKYIGLDIGTTTISSVVADAREVCLCDSKTVLNDAALPSANKWEKLQDPDAIVSLCRAMLREYMEKYPDIAGIGLTGQMHGILYLDKEGKAVSSLATWQDERGNLGYKDGVSYCGYMEQNTGYRMATGFGLTTHFYNTVNGLVPENAAAICTISDYAAMSLCENAKPLVHASNAASLGMFDVEKNMFDTRAVSALGMDESLLPEVSGGESIIGRTKDGVPVIIPIGDNQASYAGSVGADRGILLNIGTGSQISVVSDRIYQSGELECRPFIGGKFLIAGSGLCGGSSFQLLRDFFAETGSLLGGRQDANIYGILEECAQKAKDSGGRLVVDTRFRGSRQDPDIRGSIAHIGVGNLTPGHLSLGVLQGIVNELFAHYESIPDELKPPGAVTGSGNTIRKTGLLRQLIAETFGKEVKIPMHMEEAAYGAAVLAACMTENRPYKAMSEFIKCV